MYILKNAWRSIVRSKGRNVLIGVIVFVIALSSCVALSIRRSSEQARKSSLESLEITAQITMDRRAMMEGQKDRDAMREAMVNMTGLTLEELQQYAQNEHVRSFYYTVSASMDAGEELEPVDTTGIVEAEESNEESGDTQESIQEDVQEPGRMDGMTPEGMGMPAETPGEGGGQEMPGGGRGGRMGLQGDFTVTGYSSDEAMTSFRNGANSITAGEMFSENDTKMACVISEELAAYNDLNTGDEIVLVNPNDEEETYTFHISGIYRNEESSDSAGSMMGGFSPAFDTANQIYTSYENLKAVADASEEAAEVTTDENTGREYTTALRVQEMGTYTFASVEEYEAFKEEAEEELGEYYTVTSNDVSAYEQSLVPLENLSDYAGSFLAIILVIGAVILVVLNLFHIRERKYEIGVLAAIGMKKGKIAVQFVLELLCVTFAALMIGTLVGAVISVPVTNQLLEKQIESNTANIEEQDMNFGRETGMMPGGRGMDGNLQQFADRQPGGMEGGPGMSGGVQYISQITAAADITVVLQLMGIGILLTIVSGCVAVISILRYDPLRILSNRD